MRQPHGAWCSSALPQRLRDRPTMACLQHCCCGCSLKTGVVVVSVLFLLMSAAVVVVTANLIHQESRPPPAVRGGRLPPDVELVDAELTDVISRVLDEPNPASSVSTPAVAFLAIGVIQGVCAIFLLVGALTECVCLMIPWIVVDAIVLAATLVAAVVADLMVFALFGSAFGIVAAFAIAVYLVANIYALMVVGSFDYQLRHAGTSSPVPAHCSAL
ncbi:uncharacterized protein LOC126210532 [Schistocerca nitens]|uniref:uncharacterized protein LOC126210532 n=1 Tax=Schistocerca nitens TaxID=7011 RepID=UPI00211787F4|nr:uncharacterized protein LOC126210532 [Schistocerca nitens]